MIKKIISVALVAITAVSIMTGCVNKTEKASALVDTIYIGTHGVGDDPRWRNPVTGESYMTLAREQAGRKALDVVMEKHGVDIQWKTWPNSSGQDILQSVLAGDPICHLANISTGSLANVLGQNVLQTLDSYIDIFQTPDTEWMLRPEFYGDYYFFSPDPAFITDWPLCYNATMIEAVPDLKDENGNTLYPYTLYKQGKWTWSVFRDYLEKIQSFYKGKKAANGRDIVPYDTNYMHLLQMGLHSNGAHIYDGNTLGVDTPEAIEAAEYLIELMQSGLICCSAAEYGKSNANGNSSTNNTFEAGASVFMNAARWRMGGIGGTLAERGESMGIIFFPRSDRIPYKGDYVPGETEYSVPMPAVDSMAALKGFPEEETRVAIEAYVTYNIELYKNLGNVDSITEYREANLETDALGYGIDIFHPEIGDGNLEIFTTMSKLKCNETGEIMNLFGPYNMEIFGKAVYGLDNSPSYTVALKSKIQGIYDRISSVSEALKTEDAIDNVAPSINLIDYNVPIVFSKGTNPESIDWSTILTISDNVDGTYEFKSENGEFLIKANPPAEEDKEHDFEKGKMQIDVSAVDFDTAGEYAEAVVVTVSDRYDNIAEKRFTVYVYDEENTLPPVLVIKEGIPSLPLETDTSSVKWAELFAETASDATGTDLRAFVTADVSEVDVTNKGIYPLVIHVTDFAGNKTEANTFIEIK
ncbi:MAG: hypothetical protein IJC69_06750 [Clostridia bacterium]|nr:hypothetical protein [Clostridia bacterium]